MLLLGQPVLALGQQEKLSQQGRSKTGLLGQRGKELDMEPHKRNTWLRSPLLYLLPLFLSPLMLVKPLLPHPPHPTILHCNCKASLSMCHVTNTLSLDALCMQTGGSLKNGRCLLFYGELLVMDDLSLP